MNTMKLRPPDKQGITLLPPPSPPGPAGVWDKAAEGGGSPAARRTHMDAAVSRGQAHPGPRCSQEEEEGQEEEGEEEEKEKGEKGQEE